MITLSQPGLAAAIKEMRSELTAMSSFFIDYNSKVPPDVMLADMKKVITAYLAAAQPHTPTPQPAPAPASPTPKGQ